MGGRDGSIELDRNEPWDVDHHRGCTAGQDGSMAAWGRATEPRIGSYARVAESETRFSRGTNTWMLERGLRMQRAVWHPGAREYQGDRAARIM